MSGSDAEPTHAVSLGIAARAGFADEATLEGVARFRWRSLALEPSVGVAVMTGDDVYVTIGHVDEPVFAVTPVASTALAYGGLARLRVARPAVGEVALLLGATRRVAGAEIGERDFEFDGRASLAFDVGVGITHPISHRVTLGVDVVDRALELRTRTFSPWYGAETSFSRTFAFAPALRVGLLLGL